MPTTGFDTYYGDNPIAALDQNQRDWYHPILDTMFRRQSVFTGLVRYYPNLGALNAKNMTVTQLIDAHPDFDPLGLRDIWMPASHVDSRQQSITFSRYGGKVAYHEYDDIITYWKGDSAGGWASILQGQLGLHAIGVHDMLARNAFLALPLKSYCGGATNFASIATDDLMTPQIGADVWLGMTYRDVPMAQNPTLPASNGGTILCLTTPGVVYDIRKTKTDDDDWVPTVKYADPKRLLNYEVGQLNGVRYVSSPRLTLWNTGTIIAQWTITAAVTAGDGAPDPETTAVDGVYKTGQKGVTHYLQLSDLASEAPAVGDIITVHVDRTSSNGVVNGVDFNDGKLHVRRVVAVDVANDRISLDLPIMVDMATDLGAGVYGYVTKGRHVHASIFIGGPDAVVGGIGRPITVKAPPPVDDLMQVFRFSWNAYEGLNTYRPEVAEVWLSAGTVRVTGAATVQ